MRARRWGPEDGSDGQDPCDEQPYPEGYLSQEFQQILPSGWPVILPS
jgi:hypothetical protein